MNVWWNNDQMEVTAGEFTIHSGLAYLSVPDDLTRMRLLTHLLGVVP